MRWRRLSDIARVTGGSLRGPDTSVSSVSVHSADVRPGALFVALRGHRTDGHRFVAEASACGATGALVERDAGSGGPAVIVPSTEEALLALARLEREELGAEVVGITGSTGKTTTKDMTAAVCSAWFATHASPASYNNQVGVPLTILGAPEGTEVLVCEIGAGVVGEIASLCRVVRPRIGIVTNVGLAHLATFGSPENIALAKGELPEALPPAGVAVLNADDPVVAGYARRTAARTIGFGRSFQAEVRAENVVPDELARPRFTLAAGGERVLVKLRVIGEHMVANALAAAACGLALGLRVEECARELESYWGRRSRMELHDAPGGLLLIDDAYNASPSSMEAALQTVRRIAGRGRRVAVLGPMAELGELASSAHQAVGCLVAALHYELLIAVGDDTGAMVRAARTAGVPPSATVEVSDPEEAAHQLIRRSRPGDVVLVKGSRVSGLDRLSELLGAREFSSRPLAAESRGNLGEPGAVMCGDGPRIEE